MTMRIKEHLADGTEDAMTNLSQDVRSSNRTVDMKTVTDIEKGAQDTTVIMNEFINIRLQGVFRNAQQENWWEKSKESPLAQQIVNGMKSQRQSRTPQGTTPWIETRVCLQWLPLCLGLPRSHARKDQFHRKLQRLDAAYLVSDVDNQRRSCEAHVGSMLTSDTRQRWWLL